MNFYEYLSVPRAAVESQYVKTGLVNVQHHDTFPLDIYSYGRETTYENVWDGVTTKCRGVIVNRETGEIVARPFEKFFNYGTDDRPETQADHLKTLSEQPVVWEKVDGFLCTRYVWKGKQYIASKGSFHSPHAKWATAQLNKSTVQWPEGYTAVFEGVCPDFRIVVDYGQTQELILLALIDIETGVEVPPSILDCWGIRMGFCTPKQYHMIWQEATMEVLKTVKNKEGFVLTWYLKDSAPIRVKLKYLEYCRLHRMITGVSPKRVLECLSEKRIVELKEFTENTTPEFKAWIEKWECALRTRYHEIYTRARAIQATLVLMYRDEPFDRKKWALEFTKPENRDISGILFAMLDEKDYERIIWKMCKPMARGVQPMRDAFDV